MSVWTEAAARAVWVADGHTYPPVTAIVADLLAILDAALAAQLAFPEGRIALARAIAAAGGVRELLDAAAEAGMGIGVCEECQRSSPPVPCLCGSASHALCEPGVVLRLPEPSAPSRCRHPDRNGRHEVYITNGQTFCRACGDALRMPEGR